MMLQGVVSVAVQNINLLFLDRSVWNNDQLFEPFRELMHRHEYAVVRMRS